MSHHPSHLFAIPAVLLILALASCELATLVKEGAGGALGSTTTSTTSTTTSTTIPARPSAPTGFKVTDGGALTAALSWAAPPAGVEKVLVAILPAGEVWSPTDGITYAADDIAGGGRVLWTGLGSGYSASGLAVGKECRFLIFAANKRLEYSGGAETSFTVPKPAPKFAGFDFTLAEGDFWEYEYYYSKYANYGNTNFRWTANFDVMLGACSVIGGKTAFPVSLQSIGINFEPRWKWLALEDSVLYGSMYSSASGAPESASWTSILDANTGYWKGGGFFITRGDADFSRASQSLQVVNGSAMTIVTVGSGSSTSATYTNVPGYGYIASGEDSSYSTAEYFLPEIGPGGYDESFSLLSYGSGGYQSSETKRVSYVSSSMKSVVPRDFKATWANSQGSIGVWNYVRVGPGLAGLKH
ncbi:MAG: hypothetical protein WCL50_17585, partial [Spirochaetota bacterium]